MTLTLEGPSLNLEEGKLTQRLHLYALLIPVRSCLFVLQLYFCKYVQKIVFLLSCLFISKGSFHINLVVNKFASFSL